MHFFSILPRTKHRIEFHWATGLSKLCTPNHVCWIHSTLYLYYVWLGFHDGYTNLAIHFFSRNFLEQGSGPLSRWLKLVYAEFHCSAFIHWNFLVMTSRTCTGVGVNNSGTAQKVSPNASNVTLPEASATMVRPQEVKQENCIQVWKELQLFLRLISRLFNLSFTFTFLFGLKSPAGFRNFYQTMLLTTVRARCG